MKKKEDNEIKPVEVSTNPGLPTQFIDQIQVSKRGDGELYLIRFFTQLPEGSFEHSRIIIDNNLFKNFILNNLKEVEEISSSDKKSLTDIRKEH